MLDIVFRKQSPVKDALHIEQLLVLAANVRAVTASAKRRERNPQFGTALSHFRINPLAARQQQIKII
jgi:hypothetical protein